MKEDAVSKKIKKFCDPWQVKIDNDYPTSREKFMAVMNLAVHQNDAEIMEILEWVGGLGLESVYFPVVL